MPTGDEANGVGDGNPGWQVNLPFSKHFGDTYFHWNAGFTHLPAAVVAGDEYNLMAPHLSASGIWRLRPLFNVMLESVVEWEEHVEAGAERRGMAVTLSPGIRAGWNGGATQSIIGVAVPVTFTRDGSSAGVFAYLSSELPFRR